jgi:hypothetical protein
MPSLQAPKNCYTPSSPARLGGITEWGWFPPPSGEVAEWSNALDLKSSDPKGPWVRIPPSPLLLLAYVSNHRYRIGDRILQTPISLWLTGSDAISPCLYSPGISVGNSPGFPK